MKTAGNAMSTQHFTFLGHQDLSGILRGRSVPINRASEALAGGLPWVPANYSIGALNTLPADNPFGPIGEIRLVPDEATRITLDGYEGRLPFDLVLCDGRTMEREPWPYCPRTALKDAISALKAETGLTMKVAFEHEFTIRGLNQPTHVAFSLSAGRIVSHLADKVLATLGRAGIDLEQFQAEYGMDQFEISSVPVDPLTAADRVVLTLETIRDCARQLQLAASFLPKPVLNDAGNGVHIHFSLWDGETPVTARQDWLTARSGPFVAGVLDAAESLIPFTCLSANSYQRLRPHNWVGAYTCAGLRNREAMVRLVPRAPSADGENPKASIEFRVTDATANVYVALAAIIRAGLAGIKSGLPIPANIAQDPDGLTAQERSKANIRLLPQSIDEALNARTSAAGASWLGPELSGAYLACRRNDASHAAEMTFDELAAKLRHVY